ncbi:MAG TPA: energy-coupling factor ABC transporter ATP-binding protein [Candidatus Corynebacterium avicola]|uniref:Energy-coupling factor ABC transporter ATP-binding protein n=1 Tax=Candidatus Corynebacterium avicola TaxID=2838527 RepID=A0A9D1RM42_9CORY|nr:energy-coupling factor ABC transporter ATP-binding protein [Candidatus Corynebacterium avicola]
MTGSSSACTAAAVSLQGYGWRHAGRREPAIRSLDLDISAGQRVLLLGPSGSGKSTLLHALAGLLGTGEDGEATGVADLGVGPSALLGQDPESQIIAARVDDDVAFGMENLGVDPAQMPGRIREALDAVGLELPDDHPTERLSGGQQQRLALAGVLAMRPGLVLLDEPTANIDPDSVPAVRDAVASVLDSTGATLVVVEHRVEVWRDLVDRVIVLGAAGTVIADGEPDEVLGHGEAGGHSGLGEYLAEQGIWVPDLPLDLPALPPAPLQNSLSSAAPDTVLLTTKNLAVGWRGTPPLLDDLNLALQPGSTVITGANGTGKSTLAMTLAGIHDPVSGEVNHRDGAPHTWRSRQLVSRIGMVFQNPEHQFAARTVRDDLLLGPKLTGVDNDTANARVDNLLERLDLNHLAAANPFTLSGGQKRRLSVATALATRPELVILDEPTFGQDRLTFAALVTLLQELREEGTTVLSVSHDPEFVRLMGESTWAF